MKILEFDPSWGLEAYVYMSTQQLIVFEDYVSYKIKTFGSGFLLEYQDRIFCVTADHIVHPDDHYDNETGQRRRIDYYPQILTNFKDAERIGWCRNIPLECWDWTEYELDQETVLNPAKLNSVTEKIVAENIDINDEDLPLNVAIASLIDIAISEINQPPQVPILTQKVEFADGTVLIPANVLKEPLPSDIIADFNVEDSYFVAGILHKDVQNAMMLQGKYVRHTDMKFEGFNSDGGIALLKVSGSTDIENWEGLSGAPVFNYDRELVGMLVRHPGKNLQAEVIPIKTIIEYIDRCIAYESNQ